MRIFLIAAAMLLVATSAFAQRKTDEEKEKDAKRQAAEDQAYKSSIQRIPAKQGPVDPWGAARDVPSADANTAQNKAKKPAAAKPIQ